MVLLMLLKLAVSLMAGQALQTFIQDESADLDARYAAWTLRRYLWYLWNFFLRRQDQTIFLALEVDVIFYGIFGVQGPWP